MQFFDSQSGHLGSGSVFSTIVCSYADDAATAKSLISCTCLHSLTGASLNPGHVQNTVFGDTDVTYFSSLLSDFMSHLSPSAFSNAPSVPIAHSKYSAISFLVTNPAAFGARGPRTSFKFFGFLDPVCVARGCAVMQG